MSLYPHLQNHLFGYGGFGIPDDDCIAIICAFGAIPLVPTFCLSGHNVWTMGDPKRQHHVRLLTAEA